MAPRSVPNPNPALDLHREEAEGAHVETLALGDGVAVPELEGPHVPLGRDVRADRNVSPSHSISPSTLGSELRLIV